MEVKAGFGKVRGVLVVKSKDGTVKQRIPFEGMSVPANQPTPPMTAVEQQEKKDGTRA